MNNIINRLMLSLLRRLAVLFPDKAYIKLTYYLVFGKKINLNNPRTFNEKIQWLKLHDRKPIYTQMVDKYEAKKYVAERIGNEYIIPTLGIWDNFDDINFDVLPNEFVLKRTNGSGDVMICKDKKSFRRKIAKKTFNSSFKKNPYMILREWPYKNVKNRIIAEKYMVDESGTELKDYKFFCFNGEPKFFFIASERPHDTRFDFFDLDFNHLPFIQGHPIADKPLVKPKNFEKMIEITKKLSKGLTHIRIDLYNINGKIYFGELTFYHFSGMVPFEPEKWDYKFGELIIINQ